MELKAYKFLANTYAKMFMRVRNTAMNAVEYKKDKPEEVFEQMQHISNPAKWSYCGIISEEDKAVLEFVEYLLNDDYKEVNKYKFWEPNKFSNK
mgnify:CR=1 FL=1